MDLELPLQELAIELLTGQASDPLELGLPTRPRRMRIDRDVVLSGQLLHGLSDLLVRRGELLTELLHGRRCGFLRGHAASFDLRLAEVERATEELAVALRQALA